MKELPTNSCSQVGTFKYVRECHFCALLLVVKGPFVACVLRGNPAGGCRGSACHGWRCTDASWEDLEDEPPLATSTLTTTAAARTRTYCFPQCVDVVIYISVGWGGGGLGPILSCPALREPFLSGAWVISLWLLPVAAKQTHSFNTHILLRLGWGRYSFHVFPRHGEVTQFSISKQAGSPLSHPKACGSKQSCAIFQSSAPRSGLALAHPPGSRPLRDWQAWSSSTSSSGRVVALPASAAVIFGCSGRHWGLSSAKLCLPTPLLDSL